MPAKQQWHTCISVSNSAHSHFEVLFALVTHLHPAHLAHQHILTVVQHPPIYSVYLQAVTQMLSCGCFWQKPAAGNDSLITSQNEISSLLAHRLGTANTCKSPTPAMLSTSFFSQTYYTCTIIFFPSWMLLLKRQRGFFASNCFPLSQAELHYHIPSLILYWVNLVCLLISLPWHYGQAGKPTDELVVHWTMLLSLLAHCTSH